MDPNQPVPPVAAPASDPQNPASQPPAKPAEETPAVPTFSFDSFSDEDKKYLAGQGITKQEDLTQDALVKVFNHARSSQTTAQKRQAEIDKINAAINPPANPTPTNPFVQPVAPSTTPTTEPTQPATQPAQPAQGIDPVVAMLLTSNLATTYPELQAELGDGSFYKNMGDLGIPLMKGTTVNVEGLQAYASQRQRVIQLETELEAKNKPNENIIPDANGGTPQPMSTLSADTPMTKTIARNVVLFDKSNPRYAEAEKFLQENSGK